MLEGMLIVAFITQAVAAISSTISDDYFPGIGGFAAVLVYYILPILTLLDWCLFNKKGSGVRWIRSIGSPCRSPMPP